MPELIMKLSSSGHCSVKHKTIDTPKIIEIKIIEITCSKFDNVI